MDCCVVCLQSNCHLFSRITIHSPEWNREHIEWVVKKHFWWWYLEPQEEEHNKRWMCRHCWQEISSFHNFYLKVEMVHRQYMCLAKHTSETKSKECLPENTENQLFYKDKSVNAAVKSSKEGESHSSSDLLFNEKLKSKQMIGSNTHEKEEENSKIIANGCIRSEPFNDQFQTNKHNLHDFQVKEEQQNDVPSDENTNNISNDNSDTYSDRDKWTNINKRKSYSKSPEPGKLKKRDTMDFYAEFQFKLECFICNSNESTFANLCSHYKDKHNMRGFAMCCGLKFYRRHLLIDHLCVHKDPNFFKCRKCHRVYRARDNLNFHLRKNRCTSKYECNQCGKQYLMLKNLTRHKLTHLRPKDNKYVCKKGDRNLNLNSETVLQKHTQTENCELICNECGKIFLHKRSLEHHSCPTKNITNSNGENIVVSDGCIASNESNMVRMQEYDKHESGKNSKDACSSNNDVKNNKNGVKAFKSAYATTVTDEFFREVQYKMDCRICNKILPDFQSLMSHYRVIHNKIGYGMCCGTRYHRRGALADHLKLHIDPNLFKCCLCNRKFGTRRGLEEHIEICVASFKED